ILRPQTSTLFPYTTLFRSGNRLEIPSQDQTVLPASREAYDKGKSAMAEQTTEGWERAIGYFQQAIDMDPKSAAAYAALAQTYTLDRKSTRLNSSHVAISYA